MSYVGTSASACVGNCTRCGRKVKFSDNYNIAAPFGAWHTDCLKVTIRLGLEAEGKIVPEDDF